MPNQIVVKSLDRRTWTLEVNEQANVAELKQQLKDMGACGDKKLKDLVHRGKVLSDSEQIDAHSCGFLVMLTTDREAVSKPAEDGQGAQKEETRSSFWTGHHTLRVGDPCMAAWPSPDRTTLGWHPATVIAFDEASGLASVKWDMEGSFTRGMEVKYLRPRREDREPAALDGNNCTVNLPVDASGNLVVPPPEHAQELLNVAMKDPQFHNFLQSPEFATMFEPLKQMVANQPHLVPEMVDNMRRSDPHMAALVVPFLLAELEVANPEVASAVGASCAGK